MTQIKVLTTDQTQTVTNKTINADNNTLSNIKADNFKTQAVTESGKVWMVQANGTWALSALPEGAQADWAQTTSTEADYIKNKPFQNVGSGLTVKDVGGVQTLVNDYQLHFEVFTTLPAASETYKNTIGLVLKTTTETGNVYNEYACVQVESAWSWELIGDLKTTLEQAATYIKINGTELQTATDSQIGLMSAADHADMQIKSNKVTTIAATTAASDDKYPTEKATAAALDAKQNTNNLVTTIRASTSAEDTKYPSEKAVSLLGESKVPYATGSTNKTFTVGVDSNGEYYFEV